MNAILQSGLENETVLELDNVVKHYGPVKALGGVNLQVQAGQFSGLLGPNGAGKSTLFQLLTGLFVPDSGYIRVNGHDLRQHAIKALASIGVVFQQVTLDMDLTVVDNLRFHTRLHGIPGKLATQRIEREIEQLGLTDSADKQVRSLSGGNRRKVELARALLHEPAILLMDEPSVGLDPASRQSLLAYVHSLCEQRRMSVLWATHLVDEVEQANDVWVLDKGSILAHGQPQQLREQTACSTLNDAFLKLIDALDEGKAKGGMQ